MKKEKNQTIEITFYGLGGHGIVIAAKLLAEAATLSGRFAQTFASYGFERRGGQVESYVRISKNEILMRSKIYKSDVIIIMDEKLASDVRIGNKVKEKGIVLINTKKADLSINFGNKVNLFGLDAVKIAEENNLKMPNGTLILNTPVLGALGALIPLIEIESIIESFKVRGIPNIENNIQAALCAYENTKQKVGGVVEKLEITTENGDKEILHYPYFGKGNDKCNLCGRCYIFCPEGCISQNAEGYFEADLYYCKGCGICARECPTRVITMVEEEE